MLKHIEIKGYRSLKDVSLDMEPLNVLIGPNGCGKSNFMDVFALLNEAARGGLGEGILRRGGMPGVRHRSGEAGLEFTLDFASSGAVGHAEPAFAYAISIGARGTFPIILSEDMWVPGWEPENPDEPDSDGIEVIKEVIMSRGRDTPGKVTMHFGPLPAPDGPFPAPHEIQVQSESELAIFQIRNPTEYSRQHGLLRELESWAHYLPIEVGPESPMRRPQTIRPDLRVFRRCENAVAVLNAVSQTHPDVWGEMLDVLKITCPDLRDIRFPPQGGDGKVILSWLERPFENKAGFSPDDLSDGAMRMLALVAILMSPDPPPLICIDEPEL
ncbi:MAG: AAA family ATPase, partial [Candidatus Coatesbacteria bacterium]|nr:AAA family ATPase [Candidatus Coatesbacteria bacterium]